MSNYKYEYIKNKDGARIILEEYNSFGDVFMDKIKMLITLPLSLVILMMSTIASSTYRSMHSSQRRSIHALGLGLLKFGTKKIINKEELVLDYENNEIYRTKDGYTENVGVISEVETLYLTNNDYKQQVYAKVGIPVMLRIEIKTTKGTIPVFFTLKSMNDGEEILKFLTEEIKRFFKLTGRLNLIA